MLFASFVLAAVPGQDTMLALRSSAHSVRDGLRYGSGVSAGMIVWAVLAVLTLQALLATAPWVMTGVEVCGGLFLLWLASRIIRSGLGARAAKAQVAAPTRPMTTGLISSLTNAKTGLIFASVFPPALPAVVTPGAIVVVPLVVAGVVWLWMAGLAAAVGATGARVQRLLTSSGFEIASGAVIGLLGLAVLVQAAL
nr:LysE family transporter [Kineosphaera limosa]